jgi:hypothetical protein
MPSSSSWRLAIGRSWRDGWTRVLHAPAIVAGVFVMTFLLALPLAYTLRGQIEAHLGGSLMAADAADAVNYDWWQEFTSQTAGLGATFTPAIIGFAATLDNISSVLDGQPEITPIAAAIVTYLAGWALFTGGVVDRYARQRKTRAYGFFAAGGVYFFRFLRLAIVAGLVYWLLFTYVHGWLFDDWYRDLTRDMDSERRAFAVRAVMYGLFGSLLVLANLVFDYAKVRIVVEDRRNVLAGLAAALRFIARNPGRTFGLYGLNALVFLLLIGAWALVAPGAGRAGVSIWLGFALSQLYVLARLLLKLHFLASQTALFQARLAHAAYTAAPAPSWPESPAAEMISPAR